MFTMQYIMFNISFVYYYYVRKQTMISTLRIAHVSNISSHSKTKIQRSTDMWLEYCPYYGTGETHNRQTSPGHCLARHCKRWQQLIKADKGLWPLLPLWRVAWEWIHTGCIQCFCIQCRCCSWEDPWSPYWAAPCTGDRRMELFWREAGRVLPFSGALKKDHPFCLELMWPWADVEALLSSPLVSVQRVV